ncbi:phosphonate C-P lyase system protein PhnH [Cytobacillus gottheilii]|uniref:phosphonate C-P lyase system protein PhnH n=1 Tax=Cytobacillus gottheilii TaxID=859144 RepID=UPI0009BAC103|nr:phosphonate C-P lyase system protein PhnH [Cytobacillus gottheilii]
MKFNIVHDVQSVYRKLVDAISRPGELASLQRECLLVKGENYLSDHQSVLLLALTMLDQEVTFKVLSEKEEIISKVIYQLTNAKPAQLEQADYIFVLHDAEAGALEQAIHMAKEGTLYNPHLSASIIAETKSVSSGEEFLLKGPGIPESIVIATDLPRGWAKKRAAKNKEYPLGIDLFLIDADQQLLAIPRTAQMTEKQVMI